MKRITSILLLSCIVAVFWSLAAWYVIDGEIPYWVITHQQWTKDLIPHLLWQTFKEEVLFRWIPFLLIGIISPGFLKRIPVLILLIVMTSVAFGLYGLHYFPVVSVLGLVFGTVYALVLRNTRCPTQLLPLAAVFLVHLLHNVVLIFVYCRGVLH